MMFRPSTARPSRLERQAYKWVAKMLDDPGRHAPDLSRWLAKNPEHVAVYKRVATEVGYASDAAAGLPSLRVAAQSASLACQPRRAGPLAIAGLTAVLAIVALGGWRYMSSTRWQSDDAQPPTYVEVEQGSRTATLADGSTISLRGPGRARLRFSPAERAVDLEGGFARFDVAHDEARPFVVYTRGGKVRAVGTVFEVDARGDVVVRLLSGKIAVSLPRTKGAKPRRAVMLEAGQRISFGAAADPTPAGEQRTGTREPSRDLRSFDDVPVSQIIEQINARSATKVVLQNASLGQRKVFAELDIADAEAASRKIAAILGLAIDRSVPRQIKLILAN